MRKERGKEKRLKTDGRNRKKHGDSWAIGVIYPLFSLVVCIDRPWDQRQKEPQRKEKIRSLVGSIMGLRWDAWSNHNRSFRAYSALRQRKKTASSVFSWPSQFLCLSLLPKSPFATRWGCPWHGTMN